MRSILIKNINPSIGESISVDGKNGHHLINVARIKNNESIVIMDGTGTFFYGRVLNVHKKHLDLIIEKREMINKCNLFDLAFCQTKRDALEDVIKSSVEIGIDKFIPVISQYSSNHEINMNRIMSIIESAMIQSNNPFFLNLEEPIALNKLCDRFCDYDKIFYFSSTPNSQSTTLYGPLENDKILIIIGPEGGLSIGEEKILQPFKNFFSINLPTNILRSKTAIGVASGYIIGMTK